MGVNSVSSTTSTYDAYKTSKSTRTEEAASKTEKKSSSGVVYEKSSDIKKMSDSDRAALVKQLQTDQENRKSQLASLVTDMMSKQGKTFGMAQNEDSIWRFLAGGNFTVDAKTKADAQAAIADDGYWGVEQTSQRIFDFAMALSGGDDDKMDEMLAAFEKGFKQATKSWGKKLPDISQRTRDAVYEKFEQYKNGSQE
ncbi:MAG: hypothetical protein HFI75_09580 [Lachnospiraceae bacterium]|nr:hypothetical protein [Lachnospiraceae bacterium]